jgi:hypothetical protein
MSNINVQTIILKNLTFEKRKELLHQTRNYKMLQKLMSTFKKSIVGRRRFEKIDFEKNGIADVVLFKNNHQYILRPNGACIVQFNANGEAQKNETVAGVKRIIRLNNRLLAITTAQIILFNQELTIVNTINFREKILNIEVDEAACRIAVQFKGYIRIFLVNETFTILKDFKIQNSNFGFYDNYLYSKANTTAEFYLIGPELMTISFSDQYLACINKCFIICLKGETIGYYDLEEKTNHFKLFIGNITLMPKCKYKFHFNNDESHCYFTFNGYLYITSRKMERILYKIQFLFSPCLKFCALIKRKIYFLDKSYQRFYIQRINKNYLK